MVIEMKDVTKTIKKSVVLDHVNLHLESGRIYGLRGKNGSGKTMLMRALCGLILPESGSITIDGEQLGREISFPRSIGALIETPSFLPGYTGLKNLEILASIQNRVGRAEIRRAVEWVGLDPDDSKKYRKYSLGMKQRLGIAAAVMEEPDIVVLDEPINALDEKGVVLVREILHQVRARGAVVLIACHDREELEFLSDEIFTIEQGAVTGRETVAKEETHET